MSQLECNRCDLDYTDGACMVCFNALHDAMYEEKKEVQAELAQLREKCDEYQEALEFYAKKEVWGIDLPGLLTAIDPCDQEGVEGRTRGGKRARAILEKWKGKG